MVIGSKVAIVPKVVIGTKMVIGSKVAIVPKVVSGPKVVIEYQGCHWKQGGQ